VVDASRGGVFGGLKGGLLHEASKKGGVDCGEVFDDGFGREGGGGAGGIAVSDGKGGQAGVMGGPEAAGAVLDGDAAGGDRGLREVGDELFEGEAVALGVGFGVGDVVGSDEKAEIVIQPGELEEEFDLVSAGTGADGGRDVVVGEIVDEGRDAGQEVGVLGDCMEDLGIFGFHEAGDQVRGRVPACVGEDVAEEVAVVVGEVFLTVCLPVELDAAVIESGEEGVIVEGFAVGDDAVEVEDDRLEHRDLVLSVRVY